jgi:hypothetical protein
MGSVRSNNETCPNGTTNSYHGNLPRLETTMQMVMRILLEILGMGDIQIRILAFLLRRIPGTLWTAGHFEASAGCDIGNLASGELETP